MKKGVILNNIGSPEAPDTASVKRYLREFLMDPGVIDIPFIFRFILVYGIISIFRAPKSAAKYQKIWTPHGSPLVYLTQSVAKKIESYKNNLCVETGMVFQNPSISAALKSLGERNPDLEKIYFIPMYPQFSIATTEASEKKFKKLFDKNYKNFFKGDRIPEIYSLKPFYDQPKFIKNIARKILNHDLSQYDAMIFSYHGLPQSAILKNPHCQLNNTCCETGMKKNCYRSQCYATTSALMAELKIKIPVLTTFQSRLGGAEWIRPYTDETLIELAKRNSKRVLIACPAFTVDCLETLEEILLENREAFIQAGGLIFDYVYCLNDDDPWCQDLAEMIDEDIHFNRL